MQIRGDLVGEVSGGRGVRSAPATAKVKKKKKKKEWRGRQKSADYGDEAGR